MAIATTLAKIQITATQLQQAQIQHEVLLKIKYSNNKWTLRRFYSVLIDITRFHLWHFYSRFLRVQAVIRLSHRAYELAGYIRIAALVKAFSVAFSNKKEFTTLYSVCFVANELSRHIAHFMNCGSTFGDVLTHVSSRASNTGLLIVLSHLYRRDFRVFILLLELDIVSHWFRIYCEVMSKRCPCLHLHLFQNSLYRNPLFRLFCALSQESMYMTLYLISFDWMEHGHPVKLDFLRNVDCMHSKYFKSLAMAAPGYLVRQVATFDEIRLAMDMCVHFDHQKTCCDKPPQPPPQQHAPTQQPHIHLTPCTGRRRSRSRLCKRSRSKSKIILITPG